MPESRRRSQSAWPWLVLLLLPCLLQSPALLGWLSCNPIYSTSGLGAAGVSPLTQGACWVDGNTGGTVQSLAGLSARQLLSGHLPWWNHFSGAGLPLASEMQSASFFLPFIFLLKWSGGFLALNIVLRALAGMFTFMFLRELGLGRFAAMLGGVLFELNGTFTWLGDAPIHPIPFLPLLMFGIERCRSRAIDHRPGGPIIVALGIAYSVLGGFPETAFTDGVLALLWAVSRLDIDRRLWRPYVAKIVAGGLCGLLLSSPASIPFLHDLPGASVGMHLFAQASTVPPDRLAPMLFPAIAGAPYADGNLDGWNNFWGYLTPATALLALLGVAASPRDRRRWLLAAWFAGCLASACRTPIFGQLRDILPGFNQVNFARYVGPSAEFAAVVLASLALDQWQGARWPKLWPGRRPGLLVARCALLLAALGAGALVAGRTQLAHDAAAGRLGSILVYGSVAEASIAVAALGVLVARVATRRSRLLVGCIVTLEAVAMALPTVLSGTSDFRLDIAPVAFLQANLGLSRFYASGGSLLPNYGAYFGIGMVNAFYVPLPRAWEDYARRLTSLETPSSIMGQVGSPTDRALDFAAHRAAFTAIAVKYLVVPGANDLLAKRHDPYYEPVFDDGRTHIYRLPDAAPYFDVGGVPCSIVAVSRDTVSADCRQPARLLRREMAFRGWTARVNGRSMKVHATGLFQSVDLPAGVSTVEWRYAPRYAWVVGGALALGLVCSAILTLRAARPLRRNSAARTGPGLDRGSERFTAGR